MYTQHPQPLCNSIGKQLSGPRVDKGFPCMEECIKPLRGQTEPIRTPNTHSHCVTVIENNSHGPVLIRVGFPFISLSTPPYLHI